MKILSLLFFALALNIDALGVGVAYGIRHIKLPFASLLITSLVSMAAISISMAAGHLIGKVIPPTVAKHIGGVILVMIGAWALYQYFRQKEYASARVPYQEDQEVPSREIPEPVSILQMRFWGLIIQIYKEPHLADLDLSGHISAREAFLLGASLAMDSLAAGVAISLLGFSVITTAVFVGVGQLLTMHIGLSVGRGLNRSFLGPQIAVLPGLILIILGIVRF
ncbi:MAG: sporulation membrane protein YtaF [Firmicutes bacterium]|nr:sporulation membrane protein YtaF [Bacillota bacterium]